MTLPMDDIPTQLRALKIMDEVGSDNPLGRDAADEIDRLRGLGAEMSQSIYDAEIEKITALGKLAAMRDVVEAAKVYLNRPGGHMQLPILCEGCTQWESHALAEALAQLEKTDGP